MAKTQLTNRGTNMRRLTDKQRAFVHEYTVDYNAKRAAKAAGYKNPAAMGARLLDDKYNPHIVKAVGKIQKQNVERAELTREELIKELSALAMRDIADLCDEEGYINITNLRNVPPYIRRCIDSMDVNQVFNDEGEVVGQRVRIKMVPKLGAIDMLMKHYGMFAPQEHKVQHSLSWDELYNEDDDDLNVIEGTIAQAGEGKDD